MIDYTGKISRILGEIFNLDKDIIYDVKVSVHKEKRSLNANSYLWKLCTLIADTLGLSKDEVYENMLSSYGKSILVPVPKGEKPNEYFKYSFYECSSKLNGKEADWYRVCKGSSQYDTKEMSVLLNGVVEEAKNLGIKTKEDYEIEKMIEEWDKK